MIDKRYYRKDIYGRETFDHVAYEDNEQMQILSQNARAQGLKKKCLASHNIFSFLKRIKSSKTHVR